MFKTPSGRPASIASSARIIAAPERKSNRIVSQYAYRYGKIFPFIGEDKVELIIL